MRDSLVAPRLAAAGNLTATANATAVDLGKGNVLAPMDFLIYIPAINAGADTVDFILQQSDDNFSTTQEQVYVPQQTNFTAPISVGFKAMIRRRYIRLRAVVAGSSPNFGAVTCYASTGLTGRDFNIKNT